MKEKQGCTKNSFPKVLRIYGPNLISEELSTNLKTNKQKPTNIWVYQVTILFGANQPRAS